MKDGARGGVGARRQTLVAGWSVYAVYEAIANVGI